VVADTSHREEMGAAWSGLSDSWVNRPAEASQEAAQEAASISSSSRSQSEQQRQRQRRRPGLLCEAQSRQRRQGRARLRDEIRGTSSEQCPNSGAEFQRCTPLGTDGSLFLGRCRLPRSPCYGSSAPAPCGLVPGSRPGLSITGCYRKSAARRSKCPAADHSR
jgi:hypothetical protein